MQITVQVLAKVQGPNGIRLSPGKIVTLEDSPYVRVLLKSGNVLLVDPPSLDPDFLHKAGLVVKEEVKEETFLTKKTLLPPKAKPKVSVEAEKPEVIKAPEKSDETERDSDKWEDDGGKTGDGVTAP